MISGAIRKSSTVMSSCRPLPYDGWLRDYKVNIGLPSASLQFFAGDELYREMVRILALSANVYVN
jgi:hypothetical protein